MYFELLMSEQKTIKIRVFQFFLEQLPTEEDIISHFEITVQGESSVEAYDDIGRFKKFIDRLFSVITEASEK